MWDNTYKDYQLDENWFKEKVDSGKGIIGCEMHDNYGWGEKFHIFPKKKAGFIRSLLNFLFKKEDR